MLDDRGGGIDLTPRAQLPSSQRVDPIVQEALLRDPQVQNAVLQAGSSALRDPTVQRQIIQVCQEKYPEAAEHVASQVSLWAQDPELAERAQRNAGVMARSSFVALAAAPGQIVSLIEQGNTGIRILAFGCGIMQSVLAFLSLAAIVLGFGMVIHPVEPALYSYQFFFSLTTALFELPPDMLERFPMLDRWQNVLLEDAKFFSKMRGRGLFYIFLGSLWLFESRGVNTIPTLVVGLYTTFIGILHIGISCGYSGKHIAEKMREVGSAVKRASISLAAGTLTASGSLARTPLYAEEVELREARGSNCAIAREL